MDLLVIVNRLEIRLINMILGDIHICVHFIQIEGASYLTLVLWCSQIFTIGFLEEHGRATTLDNSLSHDSNPVTQQIGFVHVMSRQQHSPPLTVAL